MITTERPKVLARLAGASYIAIIIFAAIAYVGVRDSVVIPTDMPHTIANLQAHQQLYRLGFASAVLTVICNLPLGLLLYELLKVVNQGLARALLVFIAVSATIEAVNLYNYISPVITATLPEYRAGFDPAALQALIRGAGKLFALGFGISLGFFGVYCFLVGYLIVRSTFLPSILGFMMIGAGIVYEYHVISLFLNTAEIPYVLFIGFVAELSLASWLLIMGVNAEKWRSQITAIAAAT